MRSTRETKTVLRTVLTVWCGCALAWAVAAPGLASAQEPVELAPTPTSVPTAVELDVYRIGPGDVLEVDVYGEPDLSGSYPVGPDGTIVFPLIGQVKLGELHVGQANHAITVLLEKDFLYDAKVNVTVREFRSQKVEVLGNVMRPGTHYLKGPTRLLDVLSRAGGISPSSAPIKRGQRLRIVRGAADGSGTPASSESTLHVDLHDLLVVGNEEVNIVLRNGDVIYVLRSDEVHVVGEVKRPGSYPFEEGMTVLKAVSLAGGPTARAVTRKVILRRIENGQEVRLKVPMEAKVAADDIIEVPLGFW